MIWAGRRDVGVGHVKHGIAGNQRRRMAVGPETQVHEIEHDRSAGDLPQRRRVLLARHLDVCGLHGQRMDLLGTQRTIREQAL